MQNLEMIEFDLRPVRQAAAPYFAAYDRAAALRDAGAARKAKRDVTRIGVSALGDAVPADARGLYLYGKADGRLASLAYVGIAATGSLWKRTEKRLRDDTCLDTSQYGRSREDVWDAAYKRMCVSMGSNPKTLIRYAFDHVKTTALFEKADRILFFVTDAPHEAIKAAESLLIYSAISAGAPLINIQERDKLTTDFAAGDELALGVIHLSGIESTHWAARAATLLSRFRGDCC